MSDCCQHAASAGIGTMSLALLFTTGLLMSVGHCIGMCGPIVGAFVLTGLSEALRPFEEYEVIITGLLTILIIMFAPSGLLGVLDKRVKPLLLRRRTRAKPPEPPPGGLPASERSVQQ